MNAIIGFRLCTLTNDELAKRVDQMTDNLYKLGPEKVISRHIPARPNDDYDLLVGELITRFTEMNEKLDKSSVIDGIIGRSTIVINFDGHLKAEIETNDVNPKVLRAVNGYGERVDVAKTIISTSDD